jgi:hypothetical protein
MELLSDLYVRLSVRFSSIRMLSLFSAAIIGHTDVKLDIGDFTKICPEISNFVQIGQNIGNFTYRRK